MNTAYNGTVNRHSTVYSTQALGEHAGDFKDSNISHVCNQRASRYATTSCCTQSVLILKQIYGRCDNTLTHSSSGINHTQTHNLHLKALGNTANR